MYSKYQNFISKHIAINQKEWEFFESKLTIKHFKKGQIIYNIGDICTELYFMESGLARAYIIDESGKDYTWSIFFNDKNSHMTNLFVIDYDSFLHQEPSNLEIEALEDSILIAISYDDLQIVYNNLKSGERFGRLMAQEAYSYLHKNIINKQIKSAKERFIEFMQTTPHLLEKVPQYHIATFLGITPQHLSRLKAQLNNRA